MGVVVQSKGTARVANEGLEELSCASCFQHLVACRQSMPSRICLCIVDAAHLVKADRQRNGVAFATYHKTACVMGR